MIEEYFLLSVICGISTGMQQLQGNRENKSDFLADCLRYCLLLYLFSQHALKGQFQE